MTEWTKASAGTKLQSSLVCIVETVIVCHRLVMKVK